MMDLNNEGLSTPSERLLRVGIQEESAPDVAAYLKAEADLQRYLEADAHGVYAQFGLLASAQALRGQSGIFSNTASERGCVYFKQQGLVSASSHAYELIAVCNGSTLPLGQGPETMGIASAISLWYGPPTEVENPVEQGALFSRDGLSDEDVESVSIEEEAVKAMDEAVADHRARRASARAEERRLRRHDRG